MNHYKPQRNATTKIIQAPALTPQLHQSYNSILNELHDYTLTQAFMDNALSLQIKNRNSSSSISSFSSIKQPKPTAQPSVNPTLQLSPATIQDPPSPQNAVPEMLVPNQKDTLFWCFYIIKHGLHAYTTIGNKHFLIEQQEKIAAIEFMRTKKDLLKEHKIKPFTSIESDLSPGNTINVKTFFALTICYELPVIYIYKNTFIDNLINHNNQTNDNNIKPHIIQWTRPNEYAFVYDASNWITLCEPRYKWASIDKPVGAASLYKTPDILDLFNKLHISTSNDNPGGPLTKKLTKKEMYDAILAYFL